MENSEVLRRVQKVLSVHLGVDPSRVVSQARIIDDLGADSLDKVELVMSLEEEFGSQLPNAAEEEAEKAESVQDILDVLIPRFVEAA